MPHPPLEEVERQRREYDEALEEARASGDRGKVKVAYYHASWARRIEAQLRDGTAPTEVRGPVHAVRIGDGVIVTGPGETFTEYGIAVKERSPGTPTLYAGYTNEILGYLPTANEYQYGGYEAGYGYKSVGLPSLFDPSVERILVETGRAARRAPLPRGGAVGRRRRLARRAARCRGSPETPLEHPSRAVAGAAHVSRARIGVIGAGFWASYQYLPFYRDHPEVDLVGVVRKDDVGPRRLPARVRARGGDELRRRAPRRRRRRRRRLVAAQPPPRARRRGARGRRPRARREADDGDARRRGGARCCRRGSGPGGGGGATAGTTRG